jgi:peptidoglycan/xylan/chitin deacetylase (PgdA/CDA1 family)
MWWVSKKIFAHQMNALSNRSVVHLDEYDPNNPDQVVLTFDDAYECVFQHAFPILKAHGYPFEIFAIGNFTGLPNSFDLEEPFAKCCTWEQFHEMTENGGRIQWHSRTHPHLPHLPAVSQAEELYIPREWRSQFPQPHLRWLAYPYGEHTAETTALARARFSGALSVYKGNSEDRFKLNRVIVEETTNFGTL